MIITPNLNWKSYSVSQTTTRIPGQSSHKRGSKVSCKKRQNHPYSYAAVTSFHSRKSFDNERGANTRKSWTQIKRDGDKITLLLAWTHPHTANGSQSCPPTGTTHHLSHWNHQPSNVLQQECSWVHITQTLRLSAMETQSADAAKMGWQCCVVVGGLNMTAIPPFILIKNNKWAGTSGRRSSVGKPSALYAAGQNWTVLWIWTEWRHISLIERRGNNLGTKELASQKRRSMFILQK